MKKTKLVGILNITPDSFSDGGLYNNAQAAQKHLEIMLESKPDIIDIGAISTKPNNPNVPTFKEEIERFKNILPILQPLKTPISIDSYNFQTIEYLIDKLPIAWINDQSGFIDKEMIKIAKDNKLKVVIMHHITIPTDTKKIVPKELNIIEEVKSWLLNKANYLISEGISSQQIILDPGIGFGKDGAQSWELIKHAKEFSKLNYQVMYGHSRKSFLSSITDKPFLERDLETAILSATLAKDNIDYLRIHNVEATARAIKLMHFMQDGRNDWI